MSLPFWDPFDGGEGPDFAENPWDTCRLAGKQVPGIVSVKCPPKQKIDVKKTHGVDGGPTRELGHEATKVEILIRIWTKSQFEILQNLIALIWRPPGKKSRLDAKQEASDRKAQGLGFDFLGTAVARDIQKNGITIDHPAALFANVKSIVMESPGTPAIGPDGVMTLQIQAVQFIPPTGTTATRKIKPPAVFREDHLNPDAKNDPGPKPSTTDNVPSLRPPAAVVSGTTH
jgi:hypothetical protein